MTPSTHSPTRQINHESAIADAEDSYREEVYAFYEVASGSVCKDLNELEAIAVLTKEYADRFNFLVGRTEFAEGESRHGFMAYLLDVISDELQHGAGAVVKAHVKKMESEK